LLIEEVRRDKKKFIQKMISSSQPSFGRFMSQAYVHYEGTKNSKYTPEKSRTVVKRLTKKLTDLRPETLREADIMSLVIDLYLLSRAKKQV
jgi:hypothetical protein